MYICYVYLSQNVGKHLVTCIYVLGEHKDEKRGRKGQLTRMRERKRGSSMTSKPNRGSPVSPSHPPWLHRNTRAMPTLQTRSFPLSSATLHYPLLNQAQRGTAPLFSTLQPCACSQPSSPYTHFICIA